LSRFVQVCGVLGAESFRVFGAVGAFDACTLVRFAWFDVIYGNAMALSPMGKFRALGLRNTVHPEYVAEPAPHLQLVEHPNQAPPGRAVLISLTSAPRSKLCSMFKVPNRPRLCKLRRMKPADNT